MERNITILLPSKDHEKVILDNFQKLSNFCLKHFENFEILIISNGSSKENIAFLDGFKKFDFVNHQILSTPGKGNAVKNGLIISKYPNILIFDSDFAYDISLALKFFDEDKKPIAPFMYIERLLTNEVRKNTSKIRLFAGSIFNYLIRKILSIDSKDTQAGFKFVNKDEFLNCTEFISSGFEYDIELFLLAKKNNIKTYSVDTSQLSKTDYSNVNIIPDSVRLFLKLFKLRQIYKIN